MKCLRIADDGQQLTITDAPRPQPGHGELLIEVRAAAVTPSEFSWYPTTHKKNGEPRKGAVPCHEFSGLVASTGDGSFTTGQEVFGMNDWYSDGALAEFCIAPSFAIAKKPRSLTHAEAASVPISALTAWQGLFDRAKLQSGDRVLVHGGAGGVGVFAVQLARLHGAHVIATVSARNSDFVSSLGVDQIVDW